VKLRDMLRPATEADREASVAKVQADLRRHRKQGATDVVRQSANTVASRARQAAGLDGAR